MEVGDVYDFASVRKKAVKSQPTAHGEVRIRKKTSRGRGRLGIRAPEGGGKTIQTPILRKRERRPS